jgi:hypothetical protein
MSPRGIKTIQASTAFVNKLRVLQDKTTDIVVAQEADNAINKINVEAERIQRARRILNRNAEIAARLEVKLMKHGTANDRLRFEACKDLLDRVGLKPVEISEVHERAYSSEEVKQALETMKEVESLSQRLSNQGSRYMLAEAHVASISTSENIFAATLDGQPEETGTDRPNTLPA